MSAVLKLVPSEKVCTKCKSVKLLGDFYQLKTGNYRSACKECWSDDCKQRAEKQKIENPTARTFKDRLKRRDIYANPELHRKVLERKSAWNRSDKYFDNYYKKRFGISFAEVKSMVAVQNGMCANVGCGCEIAIHPKDEQKKACVDHCHATGRVRAMLCVKCNTLLGHVENTKSLVFGLLDYLNKHNKVGE
jgi:hypothetical protein